MRGADAAGAVWEMHKTALLLAVPQALSALVFILTFGLGWLLADALFRPPEVDAFDPVPPVERCMVEVVESCDNP